ncbi:MAG: hypothetical protein IKN57_13855 [Parasporobacterium sp.]|nr:hypothetical protein [Parasporobacterium sp.]
MTERENFQLLLAGKQPEWVPYYRDAVQWIVPSYVSAHMATEKKIDMFGVKWTVNDAGAIADTRIHVMKDVSEWREHVHLPDIDLLDWEAMAAEDLKDADRENKLICVLVQQSMSSCFFLPLMDMMGFENGLCALFEDPEEVTAFFEYICSHIEKAIDYIVKYYNPDMLLMSDDFCSANGPMIAYSLYEEMLCPFYVRVIGKIKSYDLPLEFHMCGKGERFVEDFVSLGVNMWQPAQPLNDLKMLKNKFGNRLVLNGTWYQSSPAAQDGAPEELVRQSVRDCMDNYAEGGGFCFWDGDPMGQSDDVKQKFAWLADEARTYGRSFYHK